MEYELKLEKSARSPRHFDDRITLRSKMKSPLSSLLFSPKSPKSVEKVALIDPSLYKSNDMCSTLLTNPLIRSNIRRRMPTHPYSSIPITDIDGILTDCIYCPMDWSYQSHDIIGLALDTKVAFINPAKATKSVFHCHSADAISLKFNYNGSKIALGSLLGTIRLFDVESEEPICNCNNDSTAAYSIDCESKNDVFLSAHSDGSFVITDFRTHDNESILKKVDETCIRAVFSPDETKIAVSHGGNSVSIFDMRNLKNPITSNQSHVSFIHSMSWSPRDPNLIATAGGQYDKSIKIWNVQTGQVQKEVNTGAQICNMFWSKTYNELITTQGYPTNYSSVMVWNESDLKLTGSIKGHKDRVIYAAISPNQTTLATITEKDPLQLWDLKQKLNSGKQHTLR